MDRYKYNDWLMAKLGKFTGSEVWKLMKSGKRKDEYFSDTALTYINEKIAEILTGEAKPQFDSYSTSWGKEYEAEAVQSFKNWSGFEVEYFGGDNPTFFPYNDYSGCSPDGKMDIAGLEIKCPYTSVIHVENLKIARKFGNTDGSEAYDLAVKVLMKSIRFEYYAQMQFGMMCLNVDHWYFCSYDPRMIDERNKTAIIKVPADKEFQEEIKERLKAAAKIVTESLGIIDASPSNLICHSENGIVIVEQMKLNP